MGGRAEGLACADPGARTPIGASGNTIIQRKSFENVKIYFPNYFQSHFDSFPLCATEKFTETTETMISETFAQARRLSLES